MFDGYSTEAMYKGLAELLACRPECKKYDDGNFRIILVPKQKYPPVAEEDTYIVMEKWSTTNVSITDDHFWLTVASDGEHPDGYPTMEEALKALEIEKAIITVRRNSELEIMFQREQKPIEKGWCYAANWKIMFTFNNIANAIKLVLVFICSFLFGVVLRNEFPNANTAIIILASLPMNALLVYFWWKTR
jgi:hypothetical protein